MNQPQYFKPWLGNNIPVIGVLLFILLLCGLIPFGLFALNQQYVISYFGAQPEDISMAMQMAYVGVIAMLTIQFRFLQYFQRRSYLFVVILFSMVVSLASYYTKDLFGFMVLRVLTGFHAVATSGCVLTLFIALIPPPKTQLVASTIFYGTILSNTVVIGVFSAWITDHMDWHNIYRYLFLFQAGCLAIALILLRSGSGQRKYPLYQIDWIGAGLWLTGGICLAYTVIYGPKYYWFADDRIVVSALVATGALLLLFNRQTRLKRPYWHPAVFKYTHLVTGVILLFIYFSIKDSINLIYAYCFGIVRWDTFHVMLLGVVNIAGIVTFMILALRLIAKKIAGFRMFFIMGFGLLLLYHWWMYLIFTSDLSFSDLAGPVFLQGAASGFLFVPIVLYAVSGLPPYTGFTGIAMTAVARFSATLLSIAGFYLLQLYFNQLNKESFLGHLTRLDDRFTDRLGLFTQLFRSSGFSPGQADALASANVTRALTVQGQLLTDLYVFKTMIVLISIILVVIGIAPVFAGAYKFAKRIIIQSTVR